MPAMIAATTSATTAPLAALKPAAPRLAAAGPTGGAKDLTLLDPWGTAITITG